MVKLCAVAGGLLTLPVPLTTHHPHRLRREALLQSLRMWTATVSGLTATASAASAAVSRHNDSDMQQVGQAVTAMEELCRGFWMLAQEVQIRWVGRCWGGGVKLLGLLQGCGWQTLGLH